MSRSSLLHAGGFGFGDVLVVGLVFQLSAEVLDGFVQALLQRHLWIDNVTNIREVAQKDDKNAEKQTRGGRTTTGSDICLFAQCCPCQC